MSEQRKCRSCGAVILWVRTESGGLMPIDLEPTDDGSIIIRMGPGVGDETVYIETVSEREARLKAEEPAARTAYVSHFATCRDAGKWRRRKPSSDVKRVQTDGPADDLTPIPTTEYLSCVSHGNHVGREVPGGCPKCSEELTEIEPGGRERI